MKLRTAGAVVGEAPSAATAQMRCSKCGGNAQHRHRFAWCAPATGCAILPLHSARKKRRCRLSVLNARTLLPQSKKGATRSRVAPLISLVLWGCTAALFAFMGCKVGPDYKRPAVDVPSGYRTADSGITHSEKTNSLGELSWWEVFQDPQLRDYIAEGLTNNYDVRIAAARVLEAEAALGLARSQYFPTINAGADLVTSRFSTKGAIPPFAGVNPERRYGDVLLSMPAYEVDLWGRIRRSNEAARARLLATKDAQQTVRITLVAELATAYLDLLELDYALEISHRTYEGRTNSLALTVSREQGGVSALQDVAQARVLVHSAEATIVDLLRQREQQENAVSILLGRNPGAIHRVRGLLGEKFRTDVPVGLPSSLVERRPDIRSAEQALIAANADIGQAKAAYFPQLTLTGFYGYQSVALSDLFSAPSRMWQFGPSITFPLFTGGRLRANVKIARAQFEQALAVYQQTVQNAFREVSDGLIAYQRTREFRLRQEERTQANRDAADLATTRYEGGVTSYLEVIYNEQELFSAELNLAQARLNELLSVVSLYRALGGGWQLAPGTQTAAATQREKRR
jgi:outer membrane protein, multidrug efflux system